MEVDAKKILQELSKHTDRERVSLYLSKSLYKDFRKACGEVAPSQVMEVLMQQFIDSLKAKGKK